MSYRGQKWMYEMSVSHVVKTLAWTHFVRLVDVCIWYNSFYSLLFKCKGVSEALMVYSTLPLFSPLSVSWRQAWKEGMLARFFSASLRSIPIPSKIPKSCRNSCAGWVVTPICAFFECRLRLCIRRNKSTPRKEYIVIGTQWSPAER